jgi:hypothetical protein
MQRGDPREIAMLFREMGLGAGGLQGSASKDNRQCCIERCPAIRVKEPARTSRSPLESHLSRPSRARSFPRLSHWHAFIPTAPAARSVNPVPPITTAPPIVKPSGIPSRPPDAAKATPPTNAMPPPKFPTNSGAAGLHGGGGWEQTGPLSGSKGDRMEARPASGIELVGCVVSGGSFSIPGSPQIFGPFGTSSGISPSRILKIMGYSGWRLWRNWRGIAGALPPPITSVFDRIDGSSLRISASIMSLRLRFTIRSRKSSSSSFSVARDGGRRK